MTALFSILFSSPKISQSGIFGPEFKYFYFRTKLYSKTNSRTLTLNKTIVFQKCCPRHPNKVFSVPDLKIFSTARNFEI